MANFKVKSIAHDDYWDRIINKLPKECEVDIPTAGQLKVTLKNGTEIYMSVSEWGSLYIVEPKETKEQS